MQTIKKIYNRIIEFLKEIVSCKKCFSQITNAGEVLAVIKFAFAPTELSAKTITARIVPPMKVIKDGLTRIFITERFALIAKRQENGGSLSKNGVREIDYQRAVFGNQLSNPSVCEALYRRLADLGKQLSCQLSNFFDNQIHKIAQAVIVPTFKLFR